MKDCRHLKKFIYGRRHDKNRFHTIEKYSKNEKGLALPSVIIIIAILLIVLSAAFYAAANQTVQVSRTKAYEDALHIAEAGYYKYLWQINDNSDFYKLTTKVVDEFDPIEFYSASEPGVNPAWDGYPRKYGETEYKSGGTSAGYFQVEIVPPATDQPAITIKSTGWTSESEDIKRTIEVKVHKRQFTNYMDFSGDSLDANNSRIPWGTGTHVRGPIFTNGSLCTRGVPIFYDTVTYCEDWIRKDGYPEFKKAGQPQKGTPLVFPASNKDIVYWAENGGYVYAGRTCILLDGNELKIRNPNVSSDAIITRSLPSSGVIHVDGELFISGILDGRLTIVADDTIYITGKDPTNFDYSDAADTGGIVYSDQDIPTSPGQELSDPSDDVLGLISNGNILVDVSYWPRGAPHYKRYNRGAYAIMDINVQGALMGLSSMCYFGADDYDHLGEMGYIKFIGSKIFGRTAATRLVSGSRYWGYLGDYSFDYRMAYETPPHFLEPVNSGWEVREWREV